MMLVDWLNNSEVLNLYGGMFAIEGNLAISKPLS